MKSSKIINSYSIKITDEPILIGEKSYAQTARISLRDDAKNLIARRKMGVVDLDEVYTAINQDQDINLENCLIRNFSLSDYRKKFGLGTNVKVTLKNFNVSGSLFEADTVVDFSYSIFDGSITDFSNAHFGAGNLSFLKSNFNARIIDFSATSYSEGENSFQFANFGTGKLTFENASFTNGSISFLNAAFNDGRTSFKGVNFGDGDVSFKFAEFGKGVVLFDRAKFGGSDVDFSKVNFGTGKIDFRRSDFGSANVSFEEIQHSDDKLLFRRAKFGDGEIRFKKILAPTSELVLDEASFGEGRISFFESEVKHISLKSCMLTAYVDMRVNSCQLVDLSNAIVQSIVDFKKGIAKVDIDLLYLYGVRNLGKLFISWNGNDIPKIIGGQTKTSYNQKAEQYRILKEDFHTLGQYEDEDEAYIAFKRNELRSGFHEAQKKGGFAKVTGGINYAFQKVLFDWMGLYATSPLRVLISIFVVFGLYSFMYVIFELTNHGQISCIASSMPAWEKILDSFYFSAVTFLTIGYGECTPTGFFKIIAPLEGWSGVFMMSYFTVAFVRKILR